jgi:dienelactone hydrolase
MPSPRRKPARRSTAALLAVALTFPAMLWFTPVAHAAPGDPNATIASPTANQTVVTTSQVSIRGQATDDAGVSRASVAIRRSDTGQYLRADRTWSAGLVWLTASLAAPGARSSSFTYAWLTPPPGRYSVTAQAWDAGNHTDGTRPTVSFTVASTPPDTTKPTLSISTPSTNQVIAALNVPVTGSSSDNVGVRAVEIAIRNRTTNLYWQADGTWGAIVYAPASLSVPDGASTGWSGSWSAPAAGEFAVGARARDAAGNVSATTWRNFTVAPPGTGNCTPTTPPYGAGTLALDLVDAARGRSFDTTISYPSARGTSGDGAPVACGPFPMIVVGHGGSGTGASAVQLHRFLTQAGYVVVGPTFPAGFEYDALTEDVSFVITEMLARSAGSQAPLRGLISDRIGFIGTSKGGMIGLALYQAASIDPRIDAIVSKIGVAPSGTYDWAAGPPLLMINGTADTTAPYAQAEEDYADAAPPKGLITLQGVDHTLNVGSNPILQEAPLGFFGYFLLDQPDGLTRVQNAVNGLAIASLQAAWTG